jgi:hypothetical protein
MASTPPGAKKQKLDYTVDKVAYDSFMKTCSNTGSAPQVVIQKMMEKFAQTRQI